jgi:hypothetical protein
VVLCCLPSAWAQPFGIYQHGTVVRMQMADCMPVRHGFIANMGGGAQVLSAPDYCPEYTLVSTLSWGHHPINSFLWLTLSIFAYTKASLRFGSTNAKREIKFNIKEMTLLDEWDLMQKHMVDQLSTPARLNVLPTPTDNTMAKHGRN